MRRRRLSKAFKQPLKYSLLQGELPVYKKDSDGNVITRNVGGIEIPMEIGRSSKSYSEPVSFMGDIQDAGSEVEAAAFGLSVGSYDAVLYMVKGELPITETSRIWYQSEPKYKPDGTVDEMSADYVVKKVPIGLDYMRYPLQRIEK